jgi:hypothetical protein
MPYKGQSYDEVEYKLIPGGWDHEHCDICWAKITEGDPYWANTNKVKIICKGCYEHYKDQINYKRSAEQVDGVDGK